MTIDTLGYVKRLEAAGVPRQQAEAHAEALRDEIAPQIVTSADLGAAVDRIDARFDLVDARFDLVESRLDGRIASVESRLDGRIGSVESRLEAKIDHVAAVAKSDLEAALWRHTVTIILALVAVAGVSIAIVRALK